MNDFLNGPNFMKVCYLLAVLGLLLAGYTNKGELISLYKFTVQMCG